MARKELPALVSTEEDRQTDFSILLLLLGEEEKEQLFHYLRVCQERREQRERAPMNTASQPGV